MRAPASGFTLLEIIVALTIIGLGFSVVFAGMSGSLKNLGSAQDTGRRIELAREKLAEIDLIKRIPPTDSATGEFDDGTHWTIESAPFIASVRQGPNPNPRSIIRVDLTIEWPARHGTQKRVIQTYRYQVDDDIPIPSLKEQLRALQ